MLDDSKANSTIAVCFQSVVILLAVRSSGMAKPHEGAYNVMRISD